MPSLYYYFIMIALFGLLTTINFLLFKKLKNIQYHYKEIFVIARDFKTLVNSAHKIKNDIKKSLTYNEQLLTTKIEEARSILDDLDFLINKSNLMMDQIEAKLIHNKDIKSVLKKVDFFKTSA